MTMPTYPTMIWNGERFEMPCSTLMLPKADNIFPGIFDKQAWFSSAGMALQTEYGFIDGKICLKNIVYYPQSPISSPILKTENKQVHPKPIASKAWDKDAMWVRSWEYEDVDYFLPDISGKALLVRYLNPGCIKAERLVLFIEDSRAVSAEPWVPGANLHGLIDWTASDHYGSEGYKQLYDEGFSEEEISKARHEYWVWHDETIRR